MLAATKKKLPTNLCAVLLDGSVASQLEAIHRTDTIHRTITINTIIMKTDFTISAFRNLVVTLEDIHRTTSNEEIGELHDFATRQLERVDRIYRSLGDTDVDDEIVDKMVGEFDWVLMGVVFRKLMERLEELEVMVEQH